MQTKELLYEGKAKKVFLTDDPNVLYCLFKDDATAFNAKKKGTIVDKGKMNTAITNTIYTMLAKKGIPTHLINKVGEDALLVKKVTIIPVEVVVRNFAAGSMAKSLGLTEGHKLASTVIDFYYKSDALDDPYINESRIYAMGWATPAEMQEIKELTLRINEALKPFFEKIGIKLIDFKLEFGKTADGQVILADEITPDTCRLWDMKTNEKMDKDRFRRDLGGIEEAYQEILKRVQAQ
jgi:phosphoribosylaminoimidazole-succinocarboxamide synthase